MSAGENLDDDCPIPALIPKLLPWLPWQEFVRTSLTRRSCATIALYAIRDRYLSSAATGVTAKLDKLGQRLSAAQAAQASGSPEAVVAVSTQLIVLDQGAKVLAQNCGFYADFFEHFGFVVGEELEAIVDKLLAVLDRVNSFADAVARLQEAASSQRTLGPAARAQHDWEAY
mmetsp:Transcript_17485/g.31571  ORF Transcript_17485/g.31571 Transcript_17485/m.31571 type:complete len:172 (+) Transcript_17485:76-591(+)